MSKSGGTATTTSLGAFGAGAILNNIPLALSGITLAFLEGSYGEMWQGIKIEERMEKPKFQTKED